MFTFQDMVTALGTHANKAVNDAKKSLMVEYDLKEHEKRKLTLRDLLDFANADKGDIVLYVGLLAAIFITALRIQDSIAGAIGLAVIVVEVIGLGYMAFNFARTGYLETNQDHWARNFSVTGLFKLVSLALFGRVMPVLFYAFGYVILMAVAFNLNYQIGFDGPTEKAYNVIFSVFPVVLETILAHYLGQRFRERLARSMMQFDALWEAEREERLYNVITVRAREGKAYALKALETLNNDVSVPGVPIVPSVPNVGNTATQSGFARLYDESTKQKTGTPAKERNTEQYEQAQRVIDAYPDAARITHSMISAITGVSRGRGTSDIANLIKSIKEGNSHE